MQDLTVLGPTIDTTNLLNVAFSMPRNGDITSLAAYLILTVVPAGLQTPLTYTAQLYSSPVPNEIFTPVAGAIVNLTIPTTAIVGDMFNGIVTGLSIPVTSRTRLLFVVSVTGGGLLATDTVTGYVSAGLGIL